MEVLNQFGHTHLAARADLRFQVADPSFSTLPFFKRV